MKKISLSEALSGIEDTRRERSVMYPLHEILMIVLLYRLANKNPKLRLKKKVKHGHTKYKKLRGNMP